MADKQYYTKYDEFLNNHTINITFDELLNYNEEQFKTWVKNLRELVIDIWDRTGHPPTVGYSEEEITSQILKMSTYPIKTFLVKDLLTGITNVIRNNSNIGNCINSYFPNMMKTKITYGSDSSKAKSIYDFFKDDDLLDRFTTYANRHFKRDSFYHYSKPVNVGDLVFGEKIKDWRHFISIYYGDTNNTKHGYFLCPVKENKEYTGYNVKLKQKQNLILTDVDIEELKKNNLYSFNQLSNVDYTKSKCYTIRIYEKNQRLFPIGLKAFRVSFSQMAVNYPPLTARFIYERLISKIKNDSNGIERINIYDPSAGWGGRIAGAMSINSGTNIHYIGTDPNPDNIVLGDISKTKYDLIGGHINRLLRGKNVFHEQEKESHTFQIFRRGSESIHLDEEFQKYKNKLDIVFTSPPYFETERYSNGDEQSCNMYPQYKDWEEKFLKKTLETCYEYLKPGGYIAWNIADVKIGGVVYPLQKSSNDIMIGLGFKYVETLYMAMGQMPGGNRSEELEETEDQITNTVFGEEKISTPKIKGKMRNFCEVVKQGNSGGKLLLKYEPIFIYKK